jgi:adenylate cyclase
VNYRFDTYSLDTETLELKSGVDTITAEPQVFMLLQYLIENRERVVSRDDIIDAVWDGRIVSDSALTYAIKEARRLVGDDGKAQAVIRTLPRRGFRFVAEVSVANISDETVATQDNGTPLADKQTPATGRWRIAALAVSLAVIIATGGLVWQMFWVEKVEAASVERMAFPLPDKPSIAVLPFENLSGDATQDYLGDGITENITTALSRVPEMFVIPRTTTRAYKGKPVSVAQVAEELGVRYVLEGSVQKSNDEVRVTAQLIDALRGHHIWTKRYERQLQDAFALQDDITFNVLTELEVKLTDGERARGLRGNAKNLEAYQLVRRGMSIYFRFTKEGNPEARRLFEEAVALDPNYAFGWNILGWTHLVAANRRWAEDPAKERARALELAHKALALDPSGGAPYLLLSTNSSRGRRYDEAIAYAEKGVALIPNNPIAVHILASALILAGRPEEALPLMQSVKRYSPITPSTLSRGEGVAYHTLGRYDEAIAAFESARARNPKGVLPVALLAMTYADASRMEEARATAQDVLKLSPGFSAKGFVNSILPYKDRTKSERALATLLQLGLPE